MSTVNGHDLAAKIARLLQEAGWNQEAFAREAGINRQTVYQILQANGDGRKLRNATVAACARVLGLTVSELRDLPLERLVERVNRKPATPSAKGIPNPHTLRRLYERATQPELQAWIDRNPERAAALAEDELDELLSLQGVGGPLTAHGVETFVRIAERKRAVFQQLHVIAGTEAFEAVEKMVETLYRLVQPYASRA
jgi:transcriptional regulator with XRE-family HTH domain